MGLFESKEQNEKELIEKVTKSYIDNGFILSKSVFTMVKFTQGLFIVDIENKKWAFIESVYAKNNSNAKIYDFNDLKNYDASNGKNQGDFTSTVRIGGMLSSVSNKQTNMKITLYLNSNNIDDSIITLMDYTFDSDSIAAFNQNTHENRFNELIKCLEYIQNNKSVQYQKSLNTMALVKCSDCGKEISKKATTCIHCGCPIEKEKRKVIIERKKGFIGSDIVPTVHIDDILVGVLKTGTHFEVDIELGEHNLILDYEVDRGVIAVGSINGMVYSTPLTTAVSNKKRVEKIVITEDTKVLKIMFEKGLKMTITELDENNEKNQPNEQIKIDKENITIVKEDEITKNFAGNSSEEFTITNYNINDDMQANINSQILEKEKILSKQDKEINELQKEKSAFIENNTYLLEEIKNKEKSLSEKDKEINELQKKLETVKNNNQELSKKIKNEKTKERNEIKEKIRKNSINIFVRIINFVRYCIFSFFTLGFIVNIFKFNISMLYLFFMFAIPFPPFIYKMLFKKIKLSLKKQILIQIIAPITFMLFGIITWALMFIGG